MLKPREIEQMVEGEGLQLISMETAKRNSHIKVRVRRASDGRETVCTLSSTASDGRARLNQRADFRRFAKGLT